MDQNLSSAKERRKCHDASVARDKLDCGMSWVAEALFRGMAAQLDDRFRPNTVHLRVC